MSTNKCFLLLLLLYSTFFVFCRRRKCAKPHLMHGTSIDIHLIRHHVSLQKDDKHFCSGAIIKRFVVITAAQCVCNGTSHQVFNPKGLSVRLGSNYWNKGGISLGVFEIRCHKSYSSKSRRNDIALLRIADSPAIDKYSVKISLAKHTPKQRTQALVSGWGILKGNSPNVLQGVWVRIIDCHRYAKDGKAITKGMICAAGKYEDFYHGDTGGPLISNGRLVGIVSRGKGVYVNVAHYHNWINDQLNSIHGKSVQSRIVGGTAINIENIPYQVSLQNNGRHFCGGSTLSPSIILTAAHCMFGKTASRIRVRAGSNYWKSGGQSVGVAEIRSHYNFIRSYYTNDIALLRLDQKLKLSRSVSQIRLADKEPKHGAKAFVSGWGALNQSSKLTPYTVQGVWVDIINRSICQKTRFYNFYSKITEGMICAASLNKDACQGDSGGPLVSDGQLVGIVSWGVGCANIKFPGVYVNVAHYRNWINYQIEDMHLTL